MDRHYYAVILSNGKDLSYLKDTKDRFTGIISEDNIYIVSFAGGISDFLPDFNEKHILTEPYGRGTAPGMALSMFTILRNDPDAVMVVTPCDLCIEKPDSFRMTLSKALSFAASNKVLVTLGIVPDRADANFGYIQVSTGRDSFSINSPVKAKTFTEKPDEALARIFIDSGEFLWNSGIFVWRASVIKEEMEKHCPRITRQFTGWESNIEDKDFVTRAYSEMDRSSIDLAVMEKTDIDWIIPSDFGWSDIGVKNK